MEIRGASAGPTAGIRYWEEFSPFAEPAPSTEGEVPRLEPPRRLSGALLLSTFLVARQVGRRRLGVRWSRANASRIQETRAFFLQKRRTACHQSRGNRTPWPFRTTNHERRLPSPTKKGHPYPQAEYPGDWIHPPDSLIFSGRELETFGRGCFPSPTRKARRWAPSPPPWAD